MRLERLAPICVYMGEHIAGLGAGWGALGAWVGACLGWQRKGAELGHKEGRPPGESHPLFARGCLVEEDAQHAKHYCEGDELS